MVFIKEKPIELPERKLDYPFVRSSLGRLGVDVRHRAMQSNNYVAGSAGWALKAEGEIEARNIKIVAAAGSQMDWSYIQNVAIVNADITNLSANKINAGILTGRTVRTAASGARIQLDSTNYLQAYDASHLRMKLDTEYLRFYNASGVERGTVRGTTDYLWIQAQGTYLVLKAYGGQIQMKVGSANVTPVSMDTSYVYFWRPLKTDSNILCASAAGSSIGSASLYFNDVSAKSFTDRGCIIDIKENEALQNLRNIKKKKWFLQSRQAMKLKTKSKYSRLDYDSFPDYIKDIPKKGEKGIDLSSAISMLIAGFKGLDNRLLKLEK